MELLISIYIFISIFFVLTYSTNKWHRVNISSRQLVFIVVSFAVLLFFHCSVEINSVEDLWSYEICYKEAASLPWSNFSDAFRTKEYAFNYLSKFVSCISDEFRLFLVIYNIILFSIYYITFKKYSVNVPLSIVCMILVVYFQSIFVLRQHLAISVLLLSIPFIINKKIIPYLLICLLAFNLHFSSLVWLPVYFIYNIKNDKMLLLLIGIMAIVIIFLGNYLNDIFNFIGADYSSYIESRTSTSLTVKLIKIICLVLYGLTLRSAIFEQGINRLITVLLFLCTIGYVFAPPVALVDRMLTYYNISFIFAIPLIWAYMRSDSLKFVFVLLFIVLHGYVSIQPLFADYYKNFSIVTLDYSYYILIGLSIFLIYKYYRRKMIV